MDMVATTAKYKYETKKARIMSPDSVLIVITSNLQIKKSDLIHEYHHCLASTAQDQPYVSKLLLPTVLVASCFSLISYHRLIIANDINMQYLSKFMFHCVTA